MVDGNRQRELDEMVRLDAHVRAARGAGSPAAARRSLGAELRDLRKAAGLTLSDVAEKVQRSTATMSRLERGTSQEPREIEVNALLDVYEKQRPGLVSARVRTSVHELVTLSRESDWFNVFRDVWSAGRPSDQLLRYVELETNTEDLITFESALIPGLLQTRSFAQAMAELNRPGDPAAQERFVEFRLERQRRFDARPQHFVIAEAALRRDPGLGADAMQEQLGRLATELSDGRENVTIQIAPTTLAIPAATGGPFVVMRFSGDTPDVVYLEHRAGADFLEAPAEVDRYREEFAELTAKALDTQQSLDLVQEVMAEPRA